MDITPQSAYVHVPFCTHRCGYCNFTVVASREDLIDRYLEAISIELSQLAGPHPIDTLFLGGGTPTFLPIAHLEKLLDSLRNTFNLGDRAEFSVEANPADITTDKVRLLKQYGVNRVSLGVQSFRNDKLKLLERDHSEQVVHRSAEIIQQVIPNLSLDLIFAAPEETLDQWNLDLHKALQLNSQHISTYGLTFEKGTTFWNRLSKNEFAEIDEDLQRDMYLASIDTLTSAGLQHYEVSNFAKPGFACRHNQAYWQGKRYFAIGPGASRHIGMVRETNHRSTSTYIKRLLSGESPVAERDELTPEIKAREYLVFGLRMRNGIDVDHFRHWTGFALADLAGPIIDRYIEYGLVEQEGQQLRLTQEGLLVSDSMAVELL